MTEDHRPAALVMALRGAGISDMRVLEAMEKTPRHVFVDGPFQYGAYEDTVLPIACGQTISQPFIVAYMTQALAVGPKMRVLEIGTGSGYQAAVLSPLCRMVYTVERHRPLYDAARARFAGLKLHNVVVRHGDGHKGWVEQAPFDRIVLTASVPEVPANSYRTVKAGRRSYRAVGQTGLRGKHFSIFNQDYPGEGWGDRADTHPGRLRPDGTGHAAGSPCVRCKGATEVISRAAVSRR